MRVMGLPVGGESSKIPVASNLGYVAELRHVQHLHEPATRRNPDHLVGRLFPFAERLRRRFLGTAQLAALRAQPFYYYLLARTRHYDSIYLSAIAEGRPFIINIGCGSDTRAHRFRSELQRHATRVLECDLADAIAAKEQLAARFGAAPHVQYKGLDLNAGQWPAFEQWLGQLASAPVLVMMEGVSPYVGEDAFGRFLAMLARALPPASTVAYDYKLTGFAPDLAGSGANGPTFRLPDSADAVREFHRRLGLRLEQWEPGWQLQDRLIPELANSDIARFRQDVVITLAVQPARPAYRE